MNRSLARAGFASRVALASLLFTLSAVAQPSAKEKAAAEALFQEGKTLLEQGQHEQACAKFAASQQLDSGFGTLMNLGECYVRRGMTASAWATFKEAASLARTSGQADREDAARERARLLEAKLSRLIVHVPDNVVDLPNLEVRLNGTPIPRAVWGSPVPVDPGVQRIEVSATGYTPWSTEITAAEGPERTRVDVQMLAKEPEPKPSITPEPAPQPGPQPLAVSSQRVDDGRTQRTIGYALGGVGAAGLVVGSIFGLRAFSKNGDSEDVCRTSTLCPQNGLDLKDDARNAATVSTVAFIAGGALAAGGLALVLTAPSRANEGPPAVGLDAKRAKRSAASQRTIELKSRFDHASLGLLVEGSW